MDFKDTKGYHFFRQYISSFITGPNADALLASFGDEHQRMTDLSVAINDSLTISTASGEYLDKRLAEVGITRPPDLGMSDDAFRKMGIKINHSKQIVEAIHTILGVFFGEETVRAFTQSAVAEPYEFQDGDELWVELENGSTYKIPFQSDFFDNPSQASAQEVSDIITRFFTSQSINAYSTVLEDVSTKDKYVRIFGASKGPYSMVRIQGGRAQTVLQFPEMRATDITNNTTLWQVTRNTGSTIRFRWYSGPKPALDQIMPSDKALIYGTPFTTTGIEGTFEVTNVRAGGVTPSIDAGYFEADIPDLNGLRFTPPDTVPPPNTIGNTYSFLITQGQYEDLTFFAPKKNVPYEQSRYALAFEPSSGTLKIYVPATTKVVRRDLIGSAHLHVGYDKLNLDGTFGSALIDDDDNKIVVVNDFAIKYRQLGSDNNGVNGSATINDLIPYSVDIDYAIREGGITTVIFKNPHNISTIEWSPSVNYTIGSTVYCQGGKYTAVAASGPLTSVQNPLDNTDFWTFIKPSQNYSDLTVTIQMGFVEEDDKDNPFLGPYIIDPAAPYTLSNQVATIREPILAGERRQTLLCDGVFPNEEGELLFALNQDNQEGPIKYYGAQLAGAASPINLVSASQAGTVITVVSSAPHGAIVGSTVTIAGTSTALDGTHVVATVVSPTIYQCNTLTPAVISTVGVGTTTTLINGAVTTLLLDPAYSFKYSHNIGDDVSLLTDTIAYQPDELGSDYAPYITGTAEGRVFAEELIQGITALGIKLNIIVVYPSDIGWGNEGLPKDEDSTPHSDVVWIYSGQ